MIRSEISEVEMGP